MNLCDTQHLLWRLITAPEGVAKALGDNPLDAQRLASTVAGDGESGAESGEDACELSPQRRLDVYAEAYFARIHEVLGNDFSDLARQLGEERFADLVTSYLAISPPQRPSLRDVGERLPEFLAHGEGGAPFRKRAPWAPELARLEWVQADLFDAPDAAVATSRSFQALPAEEWAKARLKLVPAAARLTLDWPVHRLCASWQGAPASVAGPEAVSPERTELLVWRASETVSYRPLETAEAEALSRVARETSFGEVCEAAADDVGDQEAPARAANWLARWLEDELLVASDPPSTG